jgi:hypothetical protein
VIELLELALYALVAGAAAVGTIEAIRQAPGIRDLNERGVKPWACDLCMSFWMTLLIAIVAAFLPEQLELGRLWAWMPSFAVAYSWLTRVTPAPPDGGGFPGLPDGPDESE